MKSTPFNADTDYPPIPFDVRVLEEARALKDAGLPWTPHVGCFVWDPDEHMPVPSPFPRRVYFVLNIGRFTELLGSVDAVREKLVWVPTYAQVRAVLADHGASVSSAAASAAPSASAGTGASAGGTDAGAAEEYLSLYAELRRTLGG